MQSTNPVNPFPKAFHLLTSPESRAFYGMRSQQDIGLIIWAIATSITTVYNLGQQTGEAFFKIAEDVQQKGSESPQPCLPIPQVIGMLSPVKPRKHNTTKAIANDTLITKAPVTRLIESLTDTEDFCHETHLKLTKNQLIDRCAARGLEPKKSMTKRHLAELLTSSYRTIRPHQYKSRNGRVVSIA